MKGRTRRSDFRHADAASIASDARASGAGTLEAFQAHELARAVPGHGLVKRLARLAKEAAEWGARNP